MRAFNQAAQNYWSAKSVQANVANTDAQTKNLNVDFDLKNQALRAGEHGIEGQALSNEEIRQRLLYIQPELITQAKQKSVDMQLQNAINQVKLDSDKESLRHVFSHYLIDVCFVPKRLFSSSFCCAY